MTSAKYRKDLTEIVKGTWKHSNFLLAIGLFQLGTLVYRRLTL